jgi:hypothetical protein
MMRRVLMAAAAIAVAATAGCAGRPFLANSEQQPDRPLILGAGDSLGAHLFARHHRGVAMSAIQELEQASLPIGE